MLLSSYLKNTVPQLTKLSIWLGMSAIASSMGDEGELKNHFLSMGIGENTCDTLSEVLKAIAGNEVGKNYQIKFTYDLNDDLQKCIQIGIRNGLEKLKIDFLESYKLDDNEKKEIAAYLDSLGAQLSRMINSDIQIEDYIVNKQGFLFDLMQEVHQDDNLYEASLHRVTSEHLMNFITQNIDSYISQYINEELKKDDKAKTAYFIYLLEYTARTSHENYVHVSIISNTLKELAIKQNQSTTILKQIAHSQQLLHNLLRKLGVDFQAYINELDTFKNRINSRLEPSLRIPDYHNLGREFSYQYVLRYTSFISREKEVEMLWEFLNNHPKRKMLWKLITGAGGSGKSRLALEFCLQAQCVNHYVGFLEVHHLTTFDWSQWRPASPTLIVIDYVLANTEQIRNMIGQLSRNAQNGLLPHPVRVLLLEREAGDDWWKLFLNDRDIAECYDNLNIDLEPLNRDNLWRVIIEVHQKQDKVIPQNREEILHSLTAIDPKCRPLFAFLAAMALAEGKDIRNWNVHDILNNLLEREEEKIWKTHPQWSDEKFREQHKNLLALATLTAGLNISDLKKLLAFSLQWLPSPKPSEEFYKLLSDIEVREIGGISEKVYQGLQPDIVGEYYLLKRIDSLLQDDFEGEGVIHSLLQHAWDINSQGTWLSIWRCLKDFNSLPNSRVVEFLEQSSPSMINPEKDWMYWAKLQHNLAHPTYQFGIRETIRPNLKAIVDRYPKNEEITLAYMRVLANHIGLYIQLKECIKAENLYNELKEFIITENLTYERLSAYGLGALNLTNGFSSFDNLKITESVYVDLKKMVELNDEHVVLIICYGKVMSNLVYEYKGGKNLEKEREVYQELKELPQKVKKLSEYSYYSDNIALSQATCITYLIVDYIMAHEWEEAVTIYKELKELAENYLHNEEIVLQQAEGAKKLTLLHCVSKQWKKVKIFYNELKGLVKKYLHNEKILLEQADASMILIKYYGDAQLWEEAHIIFNDLAELAERYPRNEEIKLKNIQAMDVLCNPSNHVRNMGNG